MLFRNWLWQQYYWSAFGSHVTYCKPPLHILCHSCLCFIFLQWTRLRLYELKRQPSRSHGAYPQPMWLMMCEVTGWQTLSYSCAFTNRVKNSANYRPDSVTSCKETYFMWKRETSSFSRTLAWVGSSQESTLWLNFEPMGPAILSLREQCAAISPWVHHQLEKRRDLVSLSAASVAAMASVSVWICVCLLELELGLNLLSKPCLEIQGCFHICSGWSVWITPGWVYPLWCVSFGQVRKRQSHSDAEQNNQCLGPVQMEP